MIGIQAAELQRDLERLRIDYARKDGKPFKHFFCPMLLSDQEAELCLGHVVNEGIPDSSRAKVVQRADVDKWYGAMFEADFVALMQAKGCSLPDLLSNASLYKKLKPQVRRDGKQVRHYRHDSPKAPNHTPIRLDHEAGGVFQFALDMHPDEVQASLHASWEIAVDVDCRLPALVTLIKAAYLSLFRVLGYAYALSPAGIMVGHDLLGRFYLDNVGKRKDDIRAAAVKFFQPYVNMVRPIMMYSGEAPRGTVDDLKVKACFTTSRRAYAIIVCVKTKHSLNAVLMPAFDDPDAVRPYLDFLTDEENKTLRAWDCKYDPVAQVWQGSGESSSIRWPKGDETIGLA